MRRSVLDTFTKMWTGMDAHQTKFIKPLVGPFLELAMLEVGGGRMPFVSRSNNSFLPTGGHDKIGGTGAVLLDPDARVPRETELPRRGDADHRRAGQDRQPAIGQRGIADTALERRIRHPPAH